jgi:hypothetical protein
MLGDIIREFLHTAPFVPFTIYMTGGKAFAVEHPDFATLSRPGQVLVINVEGNRFAWVDLTLATRVEAAKADQPV